MLKVRDANAAAERFKSKAGAAGADYANGVKGSGASWESGTLAGESNYAAGVQEAIGRGAFGKGVRAAGASHYEARASTVGAQRYPQGVAAGAGAYASGVGPYLDAMRSASLSPRRPKGDPGNITRVQEIANLNRQVKLRQ